MGSAEDDAGTAPESAPGSAAAAAGVAAIAAGQRAVMRNPRFVTQWDFYRSPITHEIGPSARLRAALRGAGARSILRDYVPPGAIDRRTARSWGFSPRQTNRWNGAAGEAESIRIAGERGARTIPSQTYRQNGRFFTQVDWGEIRRSLWNWIGFSVVQGEAKVGASGAVAQANFDRRFMQVPVEEARRLGLTGRTSDSGDAILVPREQIAEVHSARARGQWTRATGAVLLPGGIALDAYNFRQAWSADGSQWGSNTTHWGLQAVPSYGGTAGGAAVGARLAGWSGAARFAGYGGLAGAGFGTLATQGYALYEDGGRFGPNSQAALRQNAMGLGVSLGTGAAFWILGGSFLIGTGVGGLLLGGGLLLWHHRDAIRDFFTGADRTPVTAPISYRDAFASTNAADIREAGGNVRDAVLANLTDATNAAALARAAQQRAVPDSAAADGQVGPVTSFDSAPGLMSFPPGGMATVWPPGAGPAMTSAVGPERWAADFDPARRLLSPASDVENGNAREDHTFGSAGRIGANSTSIPANGFRHVPPSIGRRFADTPFRRDAVAAAVIGRMPAAATGTPNNDELLAEIDALYVCLRELHAAQVARTETLPTITALPASIPALR
jgi:hypothetical protein